MKVFPWGSFIKDASSKIWTFDSFTSPCPDIWKVLRILRPLWMAPMCLAPFFIASIPKQFVSITVNEQHIKRLLYSAKIYIREKRFYCHLDMKCEKIHQYWRVCRLHIVWYPPINPTIFSFCSKTSSKAEIIWMHKTAFMF